MTKRVLIIFLFLCTVVVAQVLPENSAERKRLLLEEGRKLRLDVGSVNNSIFKNLSPKEAQIVRDIKFEVPNAEEDDIENCWAFQDALGRKVVIIGPAFARSLRMFIDAQLIARELNRPELAGDYVNYILDGWKENIARRSRDAEARVIESPYTFMHANPAILKAIEEPSSRLYGGSLAFALAHEVGHHILGHDVSDKKQSIQREREADTWALGVLLSVGQPPAAGLMTVAYFAALHEVKGAASTHPAPEARAAEMIRSTLENLDRFSDQARQNGVSMTVMRTRLTEALSQLEPGTESGIRGKSVPPDSEMLGAMRRVLAESANGFRGIRGKEITDSSDSMKIWESRVAIPGLNNSSIFFDGKTGYSFGARMLGKDFGRDFDRAVFDRAFVALKQLDSSCTVEKDDRDGAEVRCPKSNANLYLEPGRGVMIEVIGNKN